MLNQPRRFGLQCLLLGIVCSTATQHTAAQGQAPPAAVTIVFANLMEVETELFWIDDNGAEQSYGKIAARGEHSQQSYPGQRWRVRAAGVLIKDFVATDAPISKFPITDRLQPSQPVTTARQLRGWQATGSSRRFNETADGIWVGSTTPADGGLVASRFAASRDDEHGVVLNKPDGGFFLLSSKGLYQAAAGTADWTFVEAGSFQESSAKERFWKTGIYEGNRWQGVLMEDRQTQQWARMTEAGAMVDVWRAESDNADGVVLSQVDAPNVRMLIANGTLYVQEGQEWTPLASGRYTSAPNAGNNQALAGTANRAPNIPTATPTFNANAAQAIGQQTGSRATQADATAALKVHNDARLRVGVAPMVWSVEVARSAQAFADHLAATDPGEDYGHDPNISPTLGENLTWISGGQGSAVFGSKDWLEERVIWEENRAGETGHYTQMVWHSTRELGIGHSVGASGSVYIVGRYNRAGNMRGEAPYPNTKILP